MQPCASPGKSGRLVDDQSLSLRNTVLMNTVLRNNFRGNDPQK
jgi:hypothetical protein